jgi:hypothetical protein
VTPDELIKQMARILAGLQVPLSMRMPLGEAIDPYQLVLDDAGFGWKSAEDFERYLRQVLVGTPEAQS